MHPLLRSFIVDDAWMGLTGLEMSGLGFAFLAVALLVLSGIQNFADLWNAS